VFENPATAPNDEGKPIEVTYKFPKIKNSVVSKMTISVGDDRVIEAKIMEKKKAEEKYEDSVAAGHNAVMLKEDKDSCEMYDMSIGSIQPG